MLYILKPAASSCGRGIKIVGKKTKINPREGYIASKYVAKPHLIRGIKYDLRVYVAVTSFDPLRVYVYNDGLVRFATEPYSLDPKNLKKKYVHLTNFSINKKADNYQSNKNNTETADDSCKWDFAQLRRKFEEEKINYDYVFA